MTLNLGCGESTWGDVRQDIARGYQSSPNLIADAHQLPFKDKAFQYARCWHVMEHLQDPHQAMREILRVSEHADIRFPVDDGFRREAVWQLSTLGVFRMIYLRHFESLKLDEKTGSRMHHRWIIHPRALLPGGRYYPNKRKLFDLTRTGRKARLLKRFRNLPLPRIGYEWVIET